MEYNFDEILKVVTTSKDRAVLVNLLDNISINLFKQDKEAGKGEENEISKALVSCLSKNKTGKDETQKVQDFVTRLLEKINSLNTVNIILALEASEKIKALLSKWATETYSKNVIFDVEVDERIIGGAIIIDKGQYFDYSLQGKLEDIFVKRRKEVIDPILQS